MTDTAPDRTKPPFPWLKALLIVSLALNLLLLGGAAARFFVHDKPGRMSGISQMQLVPGRFFDDLSRDRRRELLGVFKEFKDEFGKRRTTARELTAKLAQALETQPNDAAAATAAVDAFAKNGSDLIGLGGRAALAVIAKLTPEERLLLAKHIRLRDDGGRHKGGKPDDD